MDLIMQFDAKVEYYTQLKQLWPDCPYNIKEAWNRASQGARASCKNVVATRLTKSALTTTVLYQSKDVEFSIKLLKPSKKKLKSIISIPKTERIPICIDPAIGEDRTVITIIDAVKKTGLSTKELGVAFRRLGLSLNQLRERDIVTVLSDPSEGVSSL